MIRAYLIKILFSLLDPIDEKSNGKLEDWLAENWGHPGFREYITERDKALVIQLAGGIQLATPEHRKAWQMSGQRFELLKLGQMAKTAFVKKEKRKAGVKH